MKTKLHLVLLLTLICLSNNANSQNNLTIFDINHQTQNQNTTFQIVDSIYEWLMDTNLVWKINSKSVDMAYDNYHHLINYYDKRWNGANWENTHQNSYSYDANNNKTSYSIKFWKNSSWENQYKDSFTFDSNNYKIEYLRQTGNGIYWRNSNKYTYTYDKNHKIATEIRQGWTGSKWLNFTLTKFIYDANNNLINELIQDWNGSNWSNDWQHIYTYDSKNNQLSDEYQMWGINSWVNWSKFTFIYDANNNMINKLNQKWSDTYNKWNYYYYYTWTYDVKNNSIFLLQQIWHNSIWMNYLQETSTYDINNFMKSNTVKCWDSSGTKVMWGDSNYYYFHTVVGINDLVVSKNHIIVYPNPNNGKLTINSNRKISSIEIYDLTGKLQYSDNNIKQQTSIDIDLSYLHKGIYFARIQDGKQVTTEKIIIQ